MKITAQQFSGTSGEFLITPHPEHLLQVIKSGKCDLSFFYIEREPILLKAYTGAYFYTPPNFPQFKAEWVNVGSAPIEIINVHFSCEELAGQTFRLPNQELLPADCIYDDFVYSITSLLAETEVNAENETYLKLLQNTLLFHLFKNNDRLYESLRKSLNPMIELYINENIAKKITVEELANFAGMSKSNFIRNFKKEFDLTPLNFVKKLRMEKAVEAIRESDKNISVIAYELGYQSPSQFTEDFRKFSGVTPTLYRSSISR